MAYDPESFDASSMEIEFGKYNAESRDWKYSCELSKLHIEPTIYTHFNSIGVLEANSQWSKLLERSDDKLATVAEWARHSIHQLPGGIELSRDVDGGGSTKEFSSPTMFTRWVDVGNGAHARFSESRTAMHGREVLRSPVMNGIALEITDQPTSTDPRHAVTLAVYEFARPEDKRFPWTQAKPGRVFDFTEYDYVPYTAGPLYAGHPNEVTDTDSIDQSVTVVAFILQRIADDYTNNQ